MRSVPRVLFRLSVIATTPTLATTVGATTLLGESKKGVVEASAAVDTSTGTVLAVGGKRATGASTSFCGGGVCSVTFTGNFPTDIVPSKVILNYDSSVFQLPGNQRQRRLCLSDHDQRPGV